MDFDNAEQMEAMVSQPLKIAELSNSAMATVSLTQQDLQAMSDTGQAIVQYENGDGTQQVMELFIQSDDVSDLQTISSLAEQQGIIIEQSDVVDGDQMVIKQEFSRDINLKQVEDDATSLLAKLEANNPNKYNVIRLTSDGQIIKRSDSQAADEQQMVELQETTEDVYQEIILADGTKAYIKQITNEEDLQAVQLACMPRDVLQQATFASTVSLDMQDNHNSQLVQESNETMTSEHLQPIFIPDALQGSSSNTPKIVTVQQALCQAVQESVQIPCSRAARKTIRVQLAEEGARFGADEKIYKCYQGTCGGKIFTSQHCLKVHQRQHTGDKPYPCEDPGCQKSFATSYGLKSHKRTHTGEKPYKCLYDGCLKAFKNSGDLHKHSRTHTGERPFVCPFEGCNKCFTTSNIRKVHIRVHTGERPYQCPVSECGKTFSGATNYKNHIRIHTGERPYVCTIPGCGKRFTEYSSLYKHHIVHTHTKPYTCSHCGKSYRQASTLAMHKRQTHNDDEPQVIKDVQAAPYTTHTPVSDPSKHNNNSQIECEGDEGDLVISTGDSPKIEQERKDKSIIRRELEAEVKPIIKASQPSSGKSNVSIVLPPSINSNQPSVFVITDPSQTEGVLQQIKQQFDLSQVEPIIYS